MQASQGLRQYARFPVQWPLFYANDELVGKGTVLNVSHVGCQAAGTMPVAVGMVLHVWISPFHKEEPLYVKEARVLWANEHEFGLELRQISASDHQWLIGYLDNAERRNSFRRMRPAAGDEDVAAMPLALPIKD